MVTHESYSNLNDLLEIILKLEKRIEKLEEKIVTDQAKRDIVLNKCTELMRILLEATSEVKPKIYIHGNEYEQ